MKRFSFLFTLLLALVVGSLSILLVGCDTQSIEPISNMENKPLAKALIYDSPFILDFDAADPPYIYYDCVTGVELQMHGKIYANQRVVETPSGNIIWNGSVDYNYFDPITLSGDEYEWTLVKGLNPFHDMVKVDGSYQLNFILHEFYENEIGEKLKIMVEGSFTISDDGTEYYMENYKCIQNPK